MSLFVLNWTKRV